MPGIMALTLVLTALQNTALPLVIEFSFTKEIEDRLLAPLPVAAVGAQKVVIAALRAVVAALLILPLAELILPGGADLAGASWGAVAGVLILGSLAGGCMGLVLGTAVPPNRISVTFAIVLTPLLFTGASFYSWSALSQLRWFQVVTLFNPLTYVSEGLRASLTELPHLGGGWIALGLCVSLVAFGALGLRGFGRRAVD
jgi:ABC-2 type transport system permease protein